MTYFQSKKREKYAVRNRQATDLRCILKFIICNVSLMVVEEDEI